MKVASLVERRRAQWNELERLCGDLELRGRTAGGAAGAARFASLYRSACADLALASAYQLPPGTVAYLHQLVARAHNQLYRSRRFALVRWADVVLVNAPQQIFADPCVRFCAVLFFGLFTLAMLLGWSDTVAPGFANRIMGGEQLEQMEQSFSEPLEGNFAHYVVMSSFYIRHNTGIGLKAFAGGILIIPCLYTLAFNAVALGSAFGHMAAVDDSAGDHFFEFVTAHGPFELTAVVLSAAAGLRMGLGLFRTGGLRRADSLRRSAAAAVPVLSAAVVLFFLAAMTEGFLSPSPAPYTVKALWAIFSSGAMMFYFVVLGFPREGAADGVG